MIKSDFGLPFQIENEYFQHKKMQTFSKIKNNPKSEKTFRRYEYMYTHKKALRNFCPKMFYPCQIKLGQKQTNKQTNITKQKQKKQTNKQNTQKTTFGDLSKTEFLTKKSDDRDLDRFLVKFLKMYIFIYFTLLVFK